MSRTAGARPAPRSCSSPRPAGPPSSFRRRSGRRRRGPPGGPGSTCSSSTAPGPTRSRRPLTPRLAALRAAGHLVPGGALAAGDGDHPQPRDDDDRGPAGPVRRSGERDLRPRPRAWSATSTGPPTCASRRCSSGCRATGRTTGTVLSQEVPVRHLRRPGHLPVGAAAAASRSPGTRPDAATMDALIAMVDEAGPRPGVRQPRRHRPGRAQRPHRAPRCGPPAPRGRARGHRPAGAAASSTTSRRTGRWERSVLIVLADHSMDWSLPTQPDLRRRDPARRPDLRRVDPDRPERRRRPPLLDRPGRPTAAPGWPRCAGWSPRIRACCRCSRPAELRLGPEAGDLVAYCRRGLAVHRPDAAVQPDPGQPRAPGDRADPVPHRRRHPAVRRGLVLGDPARTVDVAPTVGGAVRPAARRAAATTAPPDAGAFQRPGVDPVDLTTGSGPSPTVRAGSAAQRAAAGEGARGEPAVGQPQLDDVVEHPLIGRGGPERRRP